jgi:hypothetical protein
VLFGIALLVAFSALVLWDVAGKLRADLFELDTTIEKLTPPRRDGEGQ